MQRLWGAARFGVASLMCDAAGGSNRDVIILFVAVIGVAMVGSRRVKR